MHRVVAEQLLAEQAILSTAFVKRTEQLEHASTVANQSNAEVELSLKQQQSEMAKQRAKFEQATFTAAAELSSHLSAAKKEREELAGQLRAATMAASAESVQASVFAEEHSTMQLAMDELQSELSEAHAVAAQEQREAAVALQTSLQAAAGDSASLMSQQLLDAKALHEGLRAETINLCLSSEKAAHAASTELSTEISVVAALRQEASAAAERSLHANDDRVLVATLQSELSEQSMQAEQDMSDAAKKATAVSATEASLMSQQLLDAKVQQESLRAEIVHMRLSSEKATYAASTELSTEISVVAALRQEASAAAERSLHDDDRVLVATLQSELSEQSMQAEQDMSDAAKKATALAGAREAVALAAVAQAASVERAAQAEQLREVTAEAGEQRAELEAQLAASEAALSSGERKCAELSSLLEEERRRRLVGSTVDAVHRVGQDLHARYLAGEELERAFELERAALASELAEARREVVESERREAGARAAASAEATLHAEELAQASVQTRVARAELSTHLVEDAVRTGERAATGAIPRQLSKEQLELIVMRQQLGATEASVAKNTEQLAEVSARELQLADELSAERAAMLALKQAQIRGESTHAMAESAELIRLRMEMLDQTSLVKELRARLRLTGGFQGRESALRRSPQPDVLLEPAGVPPEFYVSPQPQPQAQPHSALHYPGEHRHSPTYYPQTQPDLRSGYRTEHHRYSPTHYPQAQPDLGVHYPAEQRYSPTYYPQAQISSGNALPPSRRQSEAGQYSTPVAPPPAQNSRCLSTETGIYRSARRPTARLPARPPLPSAYV
jgi:hypothetical protein